MHHQVVSRCFTQFQYQPQRLTSPAMEHGVMQFVTDLSIGPVELAQAVEARGLGSLFLPEHTHIATGRATPYPAGGPLPEEYRRTYDPFVGLAAAAAATT